MEFEQPYKGGPTPLWKNISVIWFTRLSSISIVFFAACMIEFILIQQLYKGPQKELLDRGLDNKYTCYESADVSFIVNILSMAVNFWYYSYLSNVEYATDQRWSQYMIILGVNIVLQLTGAVSAGVLVITEQLDKFDLCFEDLQALYIRQYFYTIGNFIII